MGKQVLVPVDDSDRSNDAMEYAMNEHGDDELIALHVVDPGHFFAGTGIDGGITADIKQMRQSYEAHAERLLDRVREAAAANNVEIETDYVVGPVPRSIVTYAEEHDIDHIVIGSHGRSGASRILLGSVAETVARRSPVSVTIVR